ncbi:Rho GTPase-activating protein 20 [Vulpes lagopus]
MTAITISLNIQIFFHTGHEHPYGIKMSHIPSTKPLPKEPEDSISPSTTQESLLEQKITEMQIQFMLKPRHPAQNKQGRDSGQKTMKSSAFRNLAFWQRAGTCKNNQCTAAPSAKPKIQRGKLFGVSLIDICDNDNLPVPILVGLNLVFYCLPEEEEHGEAKCSHANLPPNGESIRQPLAVAEKLC